MGQEARCVQILNREFLGLQCFAGTRAKPFGGRKLRLDYSAAAYEN
jgi:hypothetical protein